MEKRFTDIMDELTPEELDALLDGVEERSDEVSSARINAKVGERLFGKKEERSKRKRLPRKAFWAIAACIAVIIALGVGTYAYAAEVKEYNAAKEFFMENGLDASGLTRGEIKAVYRDITSESFTYGKTAEVIAHNMRTNSIQGWEILNEEPSAEQMSEVWAKLEERLAGMINYACDFEDESFVEDGVECVRHKFGSIEKYVGHDLKWSYTSDRMRFYFGQEVKDGTLGVGVIAHEASRRVKPEPAEEFKRRFTPAIMKFAPDGSVIWTAEWDSGMPEEQISSVFEEKDGSLTVLSERRDYEKNEFWLCVSTIGADGSLKGSAVSPTGNVWIRGAARYDEGFLAILYENETMQQRVVTIDADGRLAGEFAYSENGLDYSIKDAAFFEGKLYVAAELDDYSEMEGLLESNTPLIDEDVFTPYAKRMFTAVILVCDKDGGEPSEFYRVEGAYDGKLEVKDERLHWSISRIVSAKCMPMISSRWIDGTSSIWTYVFDENGALVESMDTGESTLIMK